MAILSDADRTTLWAEYMRDLSAEREPIAVVKADLRAAVNAIDQWVSDNAPAFNLAIPQPARNNLTAAQKVRLLMAVIRRRFLSGV